MDGPGAQRVCGAADECGAPVSSEVPPFARAVAACQGRLPGGRDVTLCK